MKTLHPLILEIMFIIRVNAIKKSMVLLKTYLLQIYVFAVIVCFVSCTALGQTPELTFTTVDGGYEILELDISIKEKPQITRVGEINDATETLKVTSHCINGFSQWKGSWLVYDIPETYWEFCARHTIPDEDHVVEGILVYYGNIYGVVSQRDGNQMLYNLDPHKYYDQEPLTWKQFYHMAVQWRTENAEVSGGDGLGLS